METTASTVEGTRPAGDASPLRLYLVRHGRTRLNAAGMLRGHLDPPLDEVGWRQAAQLGRVLGRQQLGRILSSPLRRAQETAEAIGLQARLDVERDDRLIDRDYGPWAGRRMGDVEARWGSIDAAPDVEPIDEVRSRILETLADLARELSDLPIVVVSHQVVIRLALAAVDPELGDPGGIPQATGCFNTVDLQKGRWDVVQINEIPSERNEDHPSSSEDIKSS